MGAEDTSTLNERERASLRLVSDGYNTKEIARALGVSDIRAKKVIEGAMHKLGVSRRQEAARLLAAAEGRGVRDGPGAPRTLPTDPIAGSASARNGELPLVVRDHRVPFGCDEPAAANGPPEGGGARHDLNDQQVLIRLIALIALALLGTGVMIYALGSLSDRVIITPAE